MNTPQMMSSIFSYTNTLQTPTSTFNDSNRKIRFRTKQKIVYNE